MITSQRAELPSKINAYYATWTRLGLSAALPQLHRIYARASIEMPDVWSARATPLLLASPRPANGGPVEQPYAPGGYLTDRCKPRARDTQCPAEVVLPVAQAQLTAESFDLTQESHRIGGPRTQLFLAVLPPFNSP